MAELQPYPWHGDLWRQLLARRQQGLLPHALLFGGRRGNGAEAFIRAFAARLLCDRNTELACGQCKSCLLIGADTHPDLVRLEPEEGSRAIKVDQVRAVVEFAQKSAQFGGHRVVLLTPADALNVNAANALLKTLEEPGPGTVLLLQSERAQDLLATIRSRCQRIELIAPDEAAALAWLGPLAGGEAAARIALGLARGEPLRALELIEQGWVKQRLRLLEDLQSLVLRQQDVLTVAKHWLESGADILAEMLSLIVEDLVRVLLQQETRGLHQSDLLSRYQGMTSALELRSLLNYLQRLAQVRRELAGNIQAQLLIESLFIEWSRLAKHSRGVVA